MGREVNFNLSKFSAGYKKAFLKNNDESSFPAKNSYIKGQFGEICYYITVIGVYQCVQSAGSNCTANCFKRLSAILCLCSPMSFLVINWLKHFEFARKANRFLRFVYVCFFSEANCPRKSMSGNINNKTYSQKRTSDHCLTVKYLN